MQGSVKKSHIGKGMGNRSPYLDLDNLLPTSYSFWVKGQDPSLQTPTPFRRGSKEINYICIFNTNKNKEE